MSHQITPLSAAWTADLKLRMSVRLSQSCRGCAVFGTRLTSELRVINHGDRVLYPSNDVQWFVLRDVPTRNASGSEDFENRGATLVTQGQGILRYGMPFLDFVSGARNTWDLCSRPREPYIRHPGPAESSALADYGYSEAQVSAMGNVIEPEGDTLDAAKFPELTALFIEMSASASGYAFNARDSDGRPYRAAWFNAKPKDVPVKPIQGLGSKFPVPYLVFPEGETSALLAASTEAKPSGKVIMCSKCFDYVNVEACRKRASKIESGDWVGPCPVCDKVSKWHKEDQRPARVHRYYNDAFQRQYVKAVVVGLPLVATEDCTYCGRRPTGSTFPEFSGLPLESHEFISSAGRFRVCLPVFARISIKLGQRLEAGQVWAHVLPEAPEGRWRSYTLLKRWLKLDEHLANLGLEEAFSPLLKYLWMENQVIKSPDLDGKVLMAADLVAGAVKQIRPEGLWWDMSPACTCIHDDVGVLPPVRLDYWDELVLSLPHDVAADASIIDPRIDSLNVLNLPEAAIAPVPAALDFVVPALSIAG